MPPTAAQRKETLRKLRNICNMNPDPITSRVAQAMEHAILWATMATVDWGDQSKEPALFADLIRKDLEQQKVRAASR